MPSTSTRCTAPCEPPINRKMWSPTCRRLVYWFRRSICASITRPLEGRAEADAEAVRTDLGDGDAVAVAAELQIDRAADLVARLRPAAVRRGEEVRPLGGLLLLVGLDRRGDQRDAGECRCETSRPSARTRSIQPVSALPSMTSGWSSRSSRKPLFVAPPSMMTVVSDSARRSRASASSRVRP